jgi:hypothetical protein
MYSPLEKSKKTLKFQEQLTKILTQYNKPQYDNL